MTRSFLILGGARSGKTRRALSLAAPYPTRIYIATAEARDTEMAVRIARHRTERGAGWSTIEEPLDLSGALAAHDGAGRVILIDCLTLWLSNLTESARPVEQETAHLVAAIAAARATLIVVSNELGLGLVPESPANRAFRDQQGRLNQAVAAAVDRVEFMVAGLPMAVKG